jgi:hypothetical protein
MKAQVIGYLIERFGLLWIRWGFPVPEGELRLNGQMSQSDPETKQNRQTAATN